MQVQTFLSQALKGNRVYLCLICDKQNNQYVGLDGNLVIENENK